MGTGLDHGDAGWRFPSPAPGEWVLGGSWGTCLPDMLLRKSSEPQAQACHVELGTRRQQAGAASRTPTPRMQTPIQAALRLTQNRLVPTTGSSRAWMHLRATCTHSHSLAYYRVLPIDLPPLWDTTRSQASRTVMKTLPREEAASKEGPGLHCLPKAAAPKLGLHSALTGDTPTCSTHWEPSPM